MEKRNENIFISKDYSYQKVKEIFQKTGSEFLIVYENSINNIIGILKINDFYKYSSNWNSGIVKPLYLPALKKLRNSISILQENKIALIVNEYGRMVGTITYKNIMQYIIKNIEIDYDDIIHEKITSNSIIVTSETTVEYINRILNLNLDPSVSRTIGGYLQKITGKIPDTGETITEDNIKFFILKADSKKLKEIKIYKMKENNV
jgi:magnesium and cobalt transporter